MNVFDLIPFLHIAHAAMFGPVYAVTEGRFNVLVETISKLAKRAQKLGMEAPRLEVVDTFFTPQLRWVKRHESFIALDDPRVMRKTGEDLLIKTDALVSMKRFRLIGKAPKLEGWSFVATLAHIGDETLLCAVPGCDVPRRFRGAKPICEHCKVTRRRNETFVLVHDDGRSTQVGRQCLADFLGHADPNKAAAYAESLGTLGALFDAAVGESDEECLGGGGGRGHDAWNLEEYLAYVAANVRVFGWWSRKVARDRDDVQATADSAHTAMFPPPNFPTRDILKPEPQDRERAAQALAWVRDELTPADDEGEGLSDYEHNLVVAVRVGACVHKTMGVVASVIAAYDRHLGKLVERKKAQNSEYVGTVGKRGKLGVLTVSRVIPLDGLYGTQYLNFFLDGAGNTLVWKTASEQLEVGGRYDVTATVKAHEVYQKTGVKQTQLSRAKVVLLPGLSASEDEEPEGRADVLGLLREISANG